MKSLLCLIFVCESFFCQFQKEAATAMDFIRHHKEIKQDLCRYITEEESVMALSIVAPEISQHSYMEDLAQRKAMVVFYITQDRGDFSVGYFAMKPSYVEKLERKIANDDSLRAVFGHLLPDVKHNGDEKVFHREVRCQRLRRIDQLDWQTQYLAAFMVMARRRADKLSFKTNEEKLRFYATLYNAGLDKSDKEIYLLQKKKQFPRYRRMFNYSDVAAEFYQQLRDNAGSK